MEAARRSARIGRAVVASLALAALAPTALRAAAFPIFQSTAVLTPSPGEAAPQFGLGEKSLLGLPDADPEFRLILRFPPAVSPSGRLPLESSIRLLPPLAPDLRHTGWMKIVTLASFAGSAWNSFHDGPHEKFHFTQEGFFGHGTYAGGGDKASHLVAYNGVSRLLTATYELLGEPRDDAVRLGSQISFLTGFVTEIGDATTKYGFSYEDVVFDLLGAGSAYFIARNRLEDLIGFRTGIVREPRTPKAYRVPSVGKDYSREIYTADVKLAGLARRLEVATGPARFLLVSVTYSAKGYPEAIPELRERQVGLELGLNVAEVARELGVPEHRWWGRMLLIVLDIVRFPYTGIGYRYDLNHRRWRGPDVGNGFSFPGQ